MAEAANSSPGKALIIEDRRDNIVFIANKVLKPDGWDIITARDGELGLQKALDEKPDLIITDLKLPKMHGLDVIEELNNRGVRIPTIVMTFHGSEETAIRAFRLGAVDYLIKPFKIEDIMAAIDRALQVETPAPAVDPDLSKKVVSQEQEIQRLKSLLQQALQGGGRGGAVDGDAGQWRALLEEKEAKLETLKKQSTAQFKAMNREISELREKLAEKEATITNLRSQLSQPESGAVTQAQVSKLVKSLAQTASTHKKTVEKHRKEADQLAQELHRLATSIQMMGQSLGDYASQIDSILPKEE